MNLWNSLEKTDPQYTKNFTRGGGFSGTAINATYIIKRMTETFGPCGKGWVFEILEDKFVEGHTLSNGDRALIHMIKGVIKYQIDNVWYSTGPQYGQTTFVGENRNGTFTDEEAPKKSITDAIGKCAVLLGVCADVHLGQFDDNKYVNKREERLEAKPEPKSAKPEPSHVIAAKELLAEAQAIKTSGDLIYWFERKKGALDEIKAASEKTHKYLCTQVDKMFEAMAKEEQDGDV